MIYIDTTRDKKRIDDTIRYIKSHNVYLTKQQLKTLIGQAKKGDTEEAKKGLIKLLKRKGWTKI